MQTTIVNNFRTSRKFARVFLFALVALVVLLSGCIQKFVNMRSEAVPAQAVKLKPVEGMPGSAERIVTMIPQTREPGSTPTEPLAAGEPSLMPAAVLSVATPLSKSLDEMGLQTITHRDEVGGFSFDYPANWKITDLSDEIKSSSMLYSISLRSPEPDPQPGAKISEGIRPGMEALDIGVTIGEKRTYEEAAAQRRKAYSQSETPVKIIREEEWLLPSGMKGRYFLIETQNGPASELVLVIHEHPVLIAGFGTPSLYNSIAWSIRENQ